MDPRRKKIYLVIIVICFGLSAAILAWTFIFNDPSANLPEDGQVPAFVAPREAVGNFDQGFTPPAVFPASASFNTELLDSESFQQLKPYEKLDVTGQLGRTDPFSNYSSDQKKTK